MKSLTKAKIGDEQIKKIVLKQFEVPLKSWIELNDGFYNISFLIVLEDGREVVLKVAPPKDVVILSYEEGIMASEVAFYKRVHEQTDLPVPLVYGYNTDEEIIPNPYFFMSKLEGMPLSHIGDIDETMRREIYEVLAKDLSKLHGIKGDTFGYITMREKCQGKSALEALMVSVEALYEDALRKNTGFPFEITYVRELYGKANAAFDTITEPCLVHYDLWDGNVFVHYERPLKIDGYIDFERGFYGDPAADLCQVIGYLDLEHNPWFLEIYNSGSDEPLHYDAALKTRIMAYRCYLFLIMYVECGYRDIEGSFEPQKQWVSEQIGDWFERFEAAIATL